MVERAETVHRPSEPHPATTAQVDARPSPEPPRREQSRHVNTPTPHRRTRHALTALTLAALIWTTTSPPTTPTTPPETDPYTRTTDTSRDHTRAPVLTHVTVTTPELTTTWDTTAGTVHDALHEVGAVVHPHDHVHPALDTPLTEPTTITVTRGTTTTQTTTTAIPHSTVTHTDPTQPAGTTTTTQPGRDGQQRDTYQVALTPDGTEHTRELLLSIRTEPVDEIVTRGTRPTPPRVTAGSARAIGQQLVTDRGWDPTEFTCLDQLWTAESGWSTTAANPRSSAYGIPQANPGKKMASAGADWATNPTTQITWGLEYIANRYTTPCGAWSHFTTRGWY